MASPFPFSDLTRSLIRIALTEDLAFGDVTSDPIFPNSAGGRATFVAKEPLVVAGIPVIEEVLRQIDPEAFTVFTVSDGDAISAGEFGEVHGRTLETDQAGGRCITRNEIAEDEGIQAVGQSIDPHIVAIVRDVCRIRSERNGAERSREGSGCRRG